MSIQASNSKNLYCAATPKTCPFNLSVSFTETSTSVERNTSSLVIEGYIKPNGTLFDTNYNNTLTLKWYDSKNGWKTVTSANIQDLMSNDAYYVSGTLGVEHNADGTLSGYAQIEWTRHSNNASVIYVPPSGSVATSTTALTTIPRASSISSLSGTSLGSSVSVGISRASSSFTHKVEWKIGSSSYVTASSNATMSASFTPDVSYASQYPNGTSCTCTVRVTTYNGSTQIGSSVTSSCTLSVPSSVIPTCSNISLSRIDNGVPSSWGVYVQGYSQVTASISGSGIYGSSISSYYISGTGKSTNSSSLTSGVLTSSSTYSFSAYVTDSRGRTSSTKSASITVYAYSKPSISLTAHRCDSSGNITSSGTYLKITCNYSYASVNGKNSITRSVSCNGASNTSFSSGTSFVLNANCSVTSMYTVTASISDALGNSATATVLIPTDERVMNVKSNGKGVAFGGFATKDNAVYSYWDVYGKNFYGLDGRRLSYVDEVDTKLSSKSDTNTTVTKDADVVAHMTSKSGILGFDEATGGYLRTPPNGLIPNVSGTHGYIGTSSWRFDQGYFRYINVSEYIEIDNNGKHVIIPCDRYNLGYTWYMPIATVLDNSDTVNFIKYAYDNSTHFMLFNTPNNDTSWSWGCSIWASDKSLKEHIKNTEVRHALDKLSQLKHVEFDWKDNDGHVPLGYVADDVKEILPCLVFGVKQKDDTELLHINHTTMIPLITMGIQELIEENDLLWNFDNEVADCIISLREEVDSLKETVKTMAATIDSLKAEINGMK